VLVIYHRSYRSGRHTNGQMVYCNLTIYIYEYTNVHQTFCAMYTLLQNTHTGEVSVTTRLMQRMV